MNIGSWNVLSLYRAGALNNLLEEASKYKLDILALQEIRWPGQDIITKRSYTLFYSGSNQGRHELGTGFLVNKRLRHQIIDFEAISERLCRLKMRGRFYNITIICAHAPTEEAEDEVKEQFYAELERAYQSSSTNDMKIVIGDMNAKVGKESAFRPVIGNHSLHEVSNDNGTRLVDFASANNMRIGGTLFPHRNIHKMTWTSPDGITNNQIDHALIDKRHATNLLDVRSLRGADVASDHFLIRTKVRERISRVQKERGERKTKWNNDKLKNEKDRRLYERTVSEKLDLEGTQGGTSDSDTAEEPTEKLWRTLKEVILSAAEETIGKQTKQPAKEWFDEECKEAVAKRQKARMTMIQKRTRNSVNIFAEERRNVHRICKKKKKEYWRKKVEKIQQLQEQNDMRSMYKTVNDTRRGFQPRNNLCRDRNGRLVCDKNEIVKVWAKYFQDLFHEINEEEEEENHVQNDEIWNNEDQVLEPLEEEEAENNVTGEPTLSEVREALKKLRHNKAPGVDGIPAELLQAGGEDLEKAIHKLFVEIWKTETLPREWKVGIICPIHKKGSKLECSNYRGITMLVVMYKAFTHIIHKRLTPLTENLLGEYQAGFRSNRSTTDQIFALRQILEKCWEYNIDIHQLYIDYKTAYDSVKQKEIWKTMEHFRIPPKLGRIIRATIEGTKSRCRIGNQLSEEFEIRKGVKQGDVLSPLIFNLVLEKAIRQITINPGGTIYNRQLQMLAYADDVVLIGRRKEAIQNAFVELDRGGQPLGLQVSEEKSKYMITGRRAPQQRDDRVQVGNKSLERVDEYKYLGSYINENNNIDDDIKHRIMAGNKAMFAIDGLLRSKLLNRKCKVRLYKTLIRPVICYGCEAWTLSQRNQELLNRFERKVLRRIYGPKYDDNLGGWRQLMNFEIREIQEGPQLSGWIKAQRLRWLGHVWRMPMERVVRRTVTQTPEGRRPPGRPRGRWMDNVKEDLKKLKVRNWANLTQNRDEWRHVVEEAKAHNGL